MVNIATRGRVEVGEDVLIGGFIVGGYQPERLVIRAIGPSLTGAGVADALADPSLTTTTEKAQVIASNDNWEETQKQELIDTTLAPTNPKEAASDGSAAEQLHRDCLRCGERNRRRPGRNLTSLQNSAPRITAAGLVPTTSAPLFETDLRQRRVCGNFALAHSRT